MSDEIKHGNAAGDDGFEHQDLQPSGVLYFLLVLGVAVILSIVGLKGFYFYLDAREKAEQPPLNPLVTNVPSDTRHLPEEYKGDYDKYLKRNFPGPQLEIDERGQLNGFLTNEEKTLYSYGWVDEKAGTIHIPIERAMDLLVQRGLPVRPQGASSEVEAAQTRTSEKDRKK